MNYVLTALKRVPGLMLLGGLGGALFVLAINVAVVEGVDRS